ncbi:hypothetical protein C4561_05720 [candidate division WWE3 bacterium]|jgi:hypothetical protein|uniref:Glycosyltransferase RgtA/B/C/D-like domain-containing protein n=1 Tax=candidate division WWE3 bacterium TaxID=2053526 RepID=A0A3A4ZA78_UNCKA|nr:MAG: hypothetical protein C4561_05720 [candidate division WWE3 bacterium]
MLIGEIEDQVVLLVWAQISSPYFELTNNFISNYQPYKDIFFGMLHPFMTNQPITWFFFSTLMTLFGLSFYNIFIFLTLLMNLAVSYLYFKRFKYGIVYSVIFSFSSYFWIQVGRHVVEQQLWIFPLYMIILTTSKFSNVKKSLLSGFYIAMTTLISNYYGYFLLLFSAVYYFSEILITYAYSRKVNLRMAGVLIGTYTTAFILIVLALYPYIRENFIIKGERDSAVSMRLTRPYEDFFTFSSRPWYLILPPIKNPIFGNLTSNVIEKLRNTGYFLYDDYFPAEHSGNFIGNTIIVGSALLWIISAKKFTKDESIKIYTELTTLILVFLLMMPPFFTISGFEIYTPGYLLYKLFPMFRTTARMGIIVIFLSISIFARLIQKTYDTQPELSFIKKHFKSLLFTVMIVTLAETYIPVEINKIDKAPEVYTYLKQNSDEGAKFAVYPLDQSDQAFFWLPEHERLLINPILYFTEDFDSESFTESLPSPEGLQALSDIGGSYLIVYKSAPENDVEFFNSRSEVMLVTEFEDTLLFEVQK